MRYAMGAEIEAIVSLGKDHRLIVSVIRAPEEPTLPCPNVDWTGVQRLRAHEPDLLRLPAGRGLALRISYVPEVLLWD